MDAVIRFDSPLRLSSAIASGRQDAMTSQVDDGGWLVRLADVYVRLVCKVLRVLLIALSTLTLNLRRVSAESNNTIKES